MTTASQALPPGARGLLATTYVLNAQFPGSNGRAQARTAPADDQQVGGVATYPPR